MQIVMKFVQNTKKVRRAFNNKKILIKVQIDEANDTYTKLFYFNFNIILKTH